MENAVASRMVSPAMGLASGALRMHRCPLEVTGHRESANTGTRYNAKSTNDQRFTSVVVYPSLANDLGTGGPHRHPITYRAIQYTILTNLLEVNTQSGRIFLLRMVEIE